MRIPCRKKRFLLFIATVSFVYFFILLTFHIDPSSSGFHEFTKCPACYGDGLCPNLSNLQLTGWSRLSILRYLNVKNVFYGRLNGRKVVVKKLAHDSELLGTDTKLCKRSGLSDVNVCNVAAAVETTLGESKDRVSTLIRFMNQFRTNQDATTCPHPRFVEKVLDTVTRNAATLAARDNRLDPVAVVAYTSAVNPEPLILQAFPRHEGWPFPTYLGSCGRLVVETDAGTPLSSYEGADWLTRVALAEQLLGIAQQLTDNPTGFALYLTDVSMDNFAVSETGTVTVVDVENVIVVDRFQLVQERKPGWNKRAQHLVDACHDCLSFDSAELCSHYTADHNYYAVCSGLLAPRAYYSLRGGLLHSVPTDVNGRFGLSRILAACDLPRGNYSRFDAAPALRAALQRVLEERVS
ncbi:divergent protein kinase domain 2A-like [Ornithodoros turicata]|uniref:divergent protein kinase domain 2A-like n=1 Tax=Ornithodoros turicata TaxID=34597 RepID=UPI00313A4A0D